MASTRSLVGPSLALLRLPKVHRSVSPGCLLTLGDKYQLRRYHAEHLCISKLYPGIQTQDQAKNTTPDYDGSFCLSQKHMLSNRMVHPAATGTFYMLPMLTRSYEKLCRLIDQEMQAIGSQKIMMPCLAPDDIWKTSKRWDLMGSELFKLQDRHGRDYCLAPTHEEAVTSLMALDVNFPKLKLPVKLYQIGRKFRDEKRPKHGMLRGREFEMKDLYTFDMLPSDAEKTYDEVNDAYCTLFKRLGLDVIKVEADTGAMGGSRSDEYHLAAEVGEDTLLQCSQCGKCMNEELKALDSTQCLKDGCPGTFKPIKGIEVAHAFLLGKKYSKIFQAKIFNIDDNKYEYLSMGCYGIGMTRLLAASLEVLSTPDQMRWPRLLAPHQVCIISQQTGYYFEESLELAMSLQKELLSQPNLHNEVILDDRHKLSIGKRIFTSKQYGFPHIVVVGKKAQDNPPLFEYINTESGHTEYLDREHLLQKLMNIETMIV